MIHGVTIYNKKNWKGKVVLKKISILIWMHGKLFSDDRNLVSDDIDTDIR